MFGTAEKTIGKIFVKKRKGRSQKKPKYQRRKDKGKTGFNSDPKILQNPKICIFSLVFYSVTAESLGIVLGIFRRNHWHFVNVFFRMWTFEEQNAVLCGIVSDQGKKTEDSSET